MNALYLCRRCCATVAVVVVSDDIDVGVVNGDVGGVGGGGGADAG